MKKPQAQKTRGRPSTPTSPAEQEQPLLKQAMERHPLPEVQMDMMDHMPNYDDKLEGTRCKQPFCSGKTQVYCDKCKVNLCFVPHRNCFKAAHRK
ncbi:hypothetical protein AAFF_G00184130 [Aldrovandia affinis]|uniref:Uncharacterized protein n=1 Tax=Aldrovandia affinis TaxID=143900 RepID=A0AAD7W637_9TELE|nr:hypothetical protein AAFF_G00184130 [Aldrovandia affinis]